MVLNLIHVLVVLQTFIVFLFGWVDKSQTSKHRVIYEVQKQTNNLEKKSKPIEINNYKL